MWSVLLLGSILDMMLWLKLLCFFASGGFQANILRAFQVGWLASFLSADLVMNFFTDGMKGQFISCCVFFQHYYFFDDETIQPTCYALGFLLGITSLSWSDLTSSGLMKKSLLWSDLIDGLFRPVIWFFCWKVGKLYADVCNDNSQVG